MCRVKSLSVLIITTNTMVAYVITMLFEAGLQSDDCCFFPEVSVKALGDLSCQ